MFISQIKYLRAQKKIFKITYIILDNVPLDEKVYQFQHKSLSADVEVNFCQKFQTTLFHYIRQCPFRRKSISVSTQKLISGCRSKLLSKISDYAISFIYLTPAQVVGVYIEHIYVKDTKREHRPYHRNNKGLIF